MEEACSSFSSHLSLWIFYVTTQDTSTRSPNHSAAQVLHHSYAPRITQPKKNSCPKKGRKNWNFKTLLMVLIGSPSLLTHGMRQTGFCSQACNIGRFDQDLLKPVFITCSASSETAWFYLFVVLHLSTLGPFMHIHYGDLTACLWSVSLLLLIAFLTQLNQAEQQLWVLGETSGSWAECLGGGACPEAETGTWCTVWSFGGGFWENSKALTGATFLHPGATFRSVLRVPLCQVGTS